MRRFLRYTNTIGIIIVLVYLCIYFIGFNDFDDSGMALYFQRDDFEIYFRIIMIRIGLAFTLWLIGEWLTRKEDNAIVSVISVLFSLFSITLLFRAISQALEAKKYTIFAEDTICEFHCNVVIVLSYMLVVLLTVYSVLVISGSVLILKGKQMEHKLATIGDKGKKSYIHIFIMVALTCVVVGCNFYNNRINGSSSFDISDVLLDSLFDIVIFVLPSAIILGTTVKNWIEDNKYVPAICAYISYMYITYCMIIRLYDGKLYMNLNAFDSVDYTPWVIGGCMSVIAVSIVGIIIKMIKYKKV